MKRMDVSPLPGVLDKMIAAGPVPALVMALTLKEYEVNGLKSGISIEVILASCTEISRDESGPITCILYLAMTPFRLSTGRGDQESSALVGTDFKTTRSDRRSWSSVNACVHLYDISMCEYQEVHMGT